MSRPRITRPTLPPVKDVDELRRALQLVLEDIYRELGRRADGNPGLQNGGDALSVGMPTSMLLGGDS